MLLFTEKATLYFSVSNWPDQKGKKKKTIPLKRAHLSEHLNSISPTKHKHTAIHYKKMVSILVFCVSILPPLNISTFLWCYNLKLKWTSLGCVRDLAF